MSRAVLKYVYLVLGTGLAFVLDLAATHNARERADTDGDGEAERSVASVKHQQERNLRNRGESRSPKDAATYRANELVRRPLRTVALIVGYEVLFVGVGVSAAYPDEIGAAAGSDAGAVASVISQAVGSVVPAALIPVLPVAGVVLGILFAFVVHQTCKTATDIRREWA